MYFADASGFILFPLVVHSFDLIVSAIGILSIRGTRDPGSKSLVEDPMAILQKGYSVTIVLAIIAFCGVRYFILSSILCEGNSIHQNTNMMHFGLSLN